MRQAIEEAREQVAALLGVRPRQVIFTSGGTEAANAAVWGATRSRPGGPVLCAAVEHSAVRQAAARLAPVAELAVDGHGRIVPEALADAPGARRRAGPVAGQLPVGQPRGRHGPTGGRGRRALPRGRRAPATSTPPWPPATCPWTSTRSAPTTSR